MNFLYSTGRKSPRAPLFYQYKCGESYEIELPSGEVAGKILSKRLFDFELGQLVGLKIDDEKFELKEGVWSQVKESDLSLAGGAETATRSLGYLPGGATRPKSTEITALLDPEQYDLLSRDPEASLLILGGAGCGKTTVALHRLAFIDASSRENKTYKRCLSSDLSDLFRNSQLNSLPVSVSVPMKYLVLATTILWSCAHVTSSLFWHRLASHWLLRTL